MKKTTLQGKTLWIFGIGLNAAILAKMTSYINSLLLTIGFILIITGLLMEIKKDNS
ncbi:hypothetical protein P5G61_09350 [Paenibacillus sp. F6_3S_P_1C]|uniref:Uncharacterized protein n=1 Tax=Paenibacillus vandeheii TaxID=3035917 RepID=A0ABT8J8L9_9BACL|nr:hypothetical protein [Paenibacillus vandeheii]MDN4601428.1 hypothetical protein [Paenibacillus vandeheii]